jgi:hypothetical protein
MHLPIAVTDKPSFRKKDRETQEPVAFAAAMPQANASFNPADQMNDHSAQIPRFYRSFGIFFRSGRSGMR